jgi:tRNA (guanine-N7-)-methyltransferase
MPATIKPTPAAPPAIVARDAARRAELAADLAALYPEPTSIIFEIGCGHGHLLAAYAATHPGELCLGVDLVTQRIVRAQRKQQRLKLGNLAFRKADVAETLAALPERVRLAGMFVLFPDPWPKRSHHRRRLLQTELLDALAGRAETGAWLALRTDDAGFFEWAREQIRCHPAWRLEPEIPWPFEHSTYFQEIKGPHQSLMAARKN